MGTSMALNEDIEIMATALSGKDKASLVGVLPGCADVCHIALIPEANTVWEEKLYGSKAVWEQALLPQGSSCLRGGYGNSREA
nr:hypothetical protein GCM10020185_56180 [Pseudomonas brassicacearum subsp. brassicacearum]